MRSKALFAVATVAFLLAGCQQPDPIVGTWTSNNTIQGVSATTEATYGADKSFKQVSTMSLPTGQTMKLNVTGTWTWEEGKKLKVTASDITMDTDNEQIKQMMAQGKQMMMDQMNKEAAQEITWSGNDSFSGTFQGQQMTFTRKK